MVRRVKGHCVQLQVFLNRDYGVNTAVKRSNPALASSGRILNAPLFQYLTAAPVHDFPIRDMILYTFSGVAGPRKVLEIGPGSGITAFTLSRFVGGIAAV